MTPYFSGDINSGKAYVVEAFGYDPFTHPNDLIWEESATQIDPAGSVITDLILAGRTRVESAITYVYCIGHTGRLYKIQVNNPATYNPNYDNPVLIATLSTNSPTFTRGGFLDFFGDTEKIYIGHDKGVTSINFDGTGEAFVGVLGSWTQLVPRPFQQFLGSLFIGNGENIAQIDATATVVSYAKLSPGFPASSQVRDIKVTPEGNYLQIVVAEQPLSDLTSTTPDTTLAAPADSYIFKWNGTDIGYTSYVTYPGITLSALGLFGTQQYAFGYDFLAGGVLSPVDKLVSSVPQSAFGESPLPNAVISISNTITWVTTLPYQGHLEMLHTQFGTIATYEIEPGYWAPYGQIAIGDETDVLHVPCQIMVSNFAQGASSNGYTDQIFGVPKIYFSTMETSGTPTVKYRLYKWSPIPTGLGDAMVGALYQTQNQLFSKKIKVSEVRIYSDPWIAGNSFTVELIGSGGNVIAGSAKTFTVGSNLTAGEDFAWYSPQVDQVYTLGLRVTNEGTSNMVISKVEIDYSGGGK